MSSNLKSVGKKWRSWYCWQLRQTIPEHGKYFPMTNPVFPYTVLGFGGMIIWFSFWAWFLCVYDICTLRKTVSAAAQLHQLMALSLWAWAWAEGGKPPVVRCHQFFIRLQEINKSKCEKPQSSSVSLEAFTKTSLSLLEVCCCQLFPIPGTLQGALMYLWNDNLV